MLIVGISLFAVLRLNGGLSQSNFTPPPFDETAQVGVPSDVAKTYDSLEFPVFDNVCKVFMDANPQVDGNKLKIFLTSPAENELWMRIQVYDSEMNNIGESGVIKPGEYIEDITLTKALASGDEIKVKVITYEPDTYYSLGTIKADVTVR